MKYSLFDLIQRYPIISLYYQTQMNQKFRLCYNCGSRIQTHSYDIHSEVCISRENQRVNHNLPPNPQTLILNHLMSGNSQPGQSPIPTQHQRQLEETQSIQPVGNDSQALIINQVEEEIALSLLELEESQLEIDSENDHNLDQQQEIQAIEASQQITQNQNQGDGSSDSPLLNAFLLNIIVNNSDGIVGVTNSPDIFLLQEAVPTQPPHLQQLNISQHSQSSGHSNLEIENTLSIRNLMALLRILASRRLQTLVTQLMNISLSLGGSTGGSTSMTEHEIAGIQRRRIGSNPQGICNVCQCDYMEGETTMVLNCGHYFHQNCLQPWLRMNITCPSCRRAQKDEQGESQEQIIDQ